MSTEFSFIILTFNEEQHLPRLLNSIISLAAPTFILDSGSTDATLAICKQFNVITAYHPFETHPQQWHTALTTFVINTPWIIGLDADQIITSELLTKLKSFKNDNYLDTNGIYFNRINIYKGNWIKHGGYYPKYLLKMFRYQQGYSDLNENMDHKFQVTGKTVIWKKEHLIEENLKENSIAFWVEKHNRYSDQLATEEFERIQKTRSQNIIPSFWGSPNEHNAWLKRLWWKLPRYTRPLLYFLFRMFIQRGILDGKTGIVYHFMQGFWFRLLVDIKIEEKLMALKSKKIPSSNHRYNYIKFAIAFPSLFLMLYSINLAFIGITSPGGYYIKFIDQNFNYIRYWRDFNISTVATFLTAIGEVVNINQYHLHVKGKAGFNIVYSCLGYGILSVLVAFVIAYPKPLIKKIIFLVSGILIFQLLNIIRLIIIALYWKPLPLVLKVNAHEIFNYIIYTVLFLAIYLWVNERSVNNETNGNYTA
jgi:exosortase/archaeosortase family protein